MSTELNRTDRHDLFSRLLSTNEQTPTPMVDRFLYESRATTGLPVCLEDFARNLERELYRKN